MNKVFFKKSFILLTAVVSIASGFFMFVGTASAALTWSADAGFMTWNAGTAYCGGLSTDSAIAWRLPSVNELTTAYSSGVPGGFADGSDSYWSGTTRPGESTSAWAVNNFGLGSGDKTLPGGRVRCVRSTADVVWQSGAGTTMDWNVGTAYCGGLSTDQAIVWRLPSVTELQTAWTSGVPGSFADGYYNYWSGTTNPDYSPGAFILNISNGGLGSGDKAANSNIYVRCVRSNPSSDASLISVAEQSITATGTGTQGSPKIASISVANTVHAIYVKDVVAATSDTPYLYLDSGFTTTAEPLDIAVGDTHAYIKVVVENGTDAYYDVTITRAAATTYAITDDTEDEPDRAKDISWKAEKYTDPNKSCSERLKLTIKGKNFDKDAEVSIGGKESSSVNVKNSKELTAKFCLEKLLNDKVDQKRKITVKNPDTKKGEANKQIDLGDLTSGNEVAGVSITNTQISSTGDYDQKTKEGAKQIQEALNKLGYLDAENITSTFGSITMEAVKKFQSDNGIEATGFVGELTKAKLAEKIR